MNKTFLCLFFLLLSISCWAQDWTSAADFDWPDTRTNIIFRGRTLNCVWRDGNPFVLRSDVAAAFRLPAEGDPYVELVPVLTRASYRVRPIAAGLELSPAPERTAGQGWGREPTEGVGAVHQSPAQQRAVEAFQREVSVGRLKLLKDSAKLERVTRIGSELAAASKRNVPWEFYVIDDERPNAFTTGEGVVAVSSGLLDLDLSDDELAGVLAHEIAHGTEQHTMRAVTQNYRKDKARKELQEAQELMRRYQDEFRIQTRGMDRDGANYQMAKHSYESRLVTVKRRVSEAQKIIDSYQGEQRFKRELNHSDEIDADVVGMRYAVTAGYSADGLFKALSKLKKQQVSEFGRSYSGEGRTHPSLSRRLEILKKVQHDWKR